MTKIHFLETMPERGLASALEEFESKFQYPLGKDRWFSISHRDDYTRFFRAIGEARCFVAEHQAKVTGVVSVARCQLRQPVGQIIEAAYISDLKIASPSRGHTLLRLLQDAVKWARRTPTTPGYSIVMDGTARNPTLYTGRLGIPEYVELSKLMILRIPSQRFVEQFEPIESSLADVRDCYRSLTPSQFATSGGNPAIRSLMKATGMMLSDGAACCILEDTRRCKLLYRDDGAEMISAHLSCFGYRSLNDAARLLKSAAIRCHEMGVPALFVSLPLVQSDAVLKLLPQDGIVKAPATVFGFGLPPGLDWSVNTSEI